MIETYVQDGRGHATEKNVSDTKDQKEGEEDLEENRHKMLGW